MPHFGTLDAMPLHMKELKLENGLSKGQVDEVSSEKVFKVWMCRSEFQSVGLTVA